MLSVGDTAPEFELTDHHGDTVSSEDLEGQTYVLYFYPKAKTGGCTREANAFQDHLDSFGDRDVEVFGVSTDPVDLLAEFADEEELAFRLLSDLDGDLADAYGTRRESGTAARNTFVVGPDGTVVAVFEDVSPDGHPEEVLDALDELETAA